MNRYLYLKNINTVKMADYLCDMIQNMDIEDDENCTVCPAADYCHQNHNGFLDWLKEEINIEQE